MAGMHFFDVSMTLDDLAWHFGNQHAEDALRETWNGLIELEPPRPYSFATTSFANCIATACALLIGTPIRLTAK